ncbi:WD40-repeat-containing domain protein, partial [Mucidula mucida]
CPDGESILSQCENRSFQSIVYASRKQSTLPQSAPILDFAWYPGASSSTPATYCFAASVRECPVKLLDAADGRLRASYSIVDHRERQVAPHSLAFSPGGDKLFCGFDSAFEMFNVGSWSGRPKKSRDGIKGIVSSLTHAPTSNSIAIGSLTPSPWNIAIYDLDTEPVTPVMYLGLGETASAGVTQLKFNPTSPHLLYASFRRKDGVYAWDLRFLGDGPFMHYKTGNTPTTPMTSQRIYFSLDVTGRWMSIRDQDGNIYTWDLTTTSDEKDSALPLLSFDAHRDSVLNVTYHPFEAKILSSSGGRHFLDSTDSESSDEEDVGVQRRRVLQPIARDVSLKIWDVSDKQL